MRFELESSRFSIEGRLINNLHRQTPRDRDLSSDNVDRVGAIRR
jgi:hypothetical protein